MTFEDLDYIRKILATGIIKGPVLELGAGWGGITSKPLVEAAGLKHVGTNLSEGPEVDVAADFERTDHMARFAAHAPFGSVFILNVLEHTFEPIRILDHALGLIAEGGTLVTITPSMWPIHDYPIDVYRLLPSFYDEYARRRGLELVAETFEYVLQGPVGHHRTAEGGYAFPPPRTGWRRNWGRVIHRLFGTYGRGMYTVSHSAIAAVFRKPVGWDSKSR